MRATVKASVYVPDELWEQVQKSDSDLRLSTFLQEALRERFAPRADRPYAELGEAQRRNATSTRRVVLGQMRKAYQAGYDVGLEFAKQLPWRAIADLEVAGWDIRGWRKNFDEEEYEIVNRGTGNWDPTAEAMGWDDVIAIATEHGAPFPTTDDGVPLGIPGEGFADALRDVWRGTTADADSGAKALARDGGEGGDD
jgi:hypothetical protein